MNGNRAARSSSRRITVLATLSCIACNPELDGLTNLIDSGYSYVEFPGRRVLAGNYERIELDKRSDGRAFVLGRDGAGTLAIAPFEGDSHCEVPFVADFVTSQTYRIAEPDALRYVPYSTGDGALGFTDHGCHEPFAPISGAALPMRVTAELDPPRFLTTRPAASTSDESAVTLFSCNPWGGGDEGCSELGLITAVQFGSESVWTIELVDDTRRLVLRDGSLATKTMLGNAVSELATETRDNAAAFVDDDGLQVVTAENAAPTIVETDACDLYRVYSPFADQEGLVSYVAPCDSGRLVVLDLSNGTRTELPGEGRPPVLQMPESGGFHSLYFVTGVTAFSAPEPDVDRSTPLRRADLRFGAKLPREVGRLHAVRLAAPDEALAGPEGALLASVERWSGTSVRVLADFDGTTGRLVEWDLRSQIIREIARGVLDFGPNWALADFDGTAGTLLEIGSDLSTTVAARGVPDSPQASLDGCIVGTARCFTNDIEAAALHLAVLRDFDGSAGELVLFHPASPVDPLGKPEVVSQGVRRGQYGLLLEGDAVVYLADYRDGERVGELQTRFIRSADTFSQGGVRAWRETLEPVPGILYSKVEGSNLGAWFARLR